MVAWSYGRRDRGRGPGVWHRRLVDHADGTRSASRIRIQTDDDLLSEAFPAENDGLNPESTRFVGRINGYDIYLAQNTQLNGVCIVALTDSVQPEFASMGCSGGSLTTGGLGAGVSENLVIEVGEIQPEPRGTPVRMSESVTAYRT